MAEPTENLDLERPEDGALGWGQAVRDNAAKVDALVDVLPMVPQGADPVIDPDRLLVYAKRTGGRAMLKVLSPIGRDYQLQPALFGNFVGMINTNRTSSLTNIAMPHSSVGVISHLTALADLQNYGRMASIASAAATVNGLAVVQSTDAMFFRGNVPGFGGWWSSMRVGTVHIDQIRVFVGMTNGTTTSLYTPTSNFNLIGFFYDSSVSPNWHFWMKNSTAAGTLTDTGIAAEVGRVYDFYTRCVPNGSEVEWAIELPGPGTSVSGVASASMPGATVIMRPQISAQSLEPAGATRSIRFQRIYVESDR